MLLERLERRGDFRKTLVLKGSQSRLAFYLYQFTVTVSTCLNPLIQWRYPNFLRQQFGVRGKERLVFNALNVFAVVPVYVVEAPSG